MKKNLYILAAVALTALLGGCAEDKLGQGDGSGHPQGGINFNIGGVETRTSYSNQDWLQIEWTSGDQVKIFCSNTQAPTTSSPTDADWAPKTVATYSVTPVAHTHSVTVGGESHDITTNCKGTLSSTAGLYWTSGKHIFYAAYGADATMADAASGVVKCKYSPNQQLTQKNDGAYACMEQAYMVAKAEYNEPADNVTLQFQPIMTTLEVRVQGPASGSAINLTSMTVTVPKTQDVTYHDANGNIFFDYNINTGQVVNAPTTDTKAETYVFHFASAMTLAVGGELRITAILPPVLIDKDNRVKITFTSKEAASDVVTRFPASATSTDRVQISYKGVTKTPNWVTPALPPGVPENEPTPSTDDDSAGDQNEPSNDDDQTKYAETNPWQEKIFGKVGSEYDNVLLSSVSLPGSNFSGTYAEHLGGLFTVSHRYQSTELRDQLAQGIRVFDLHPITVKPVGLGNDPQVVESDGGNDSSGKYSFAQWVNNTSAPTTAVRKYYDVSRLFRDFLDFTATNGTKPHENEFIVVFIDPVLGMSGTTYNRDGNLTANMVNATLTNQWDAKGWIIPYRKDLTIADARGKMIVIVRGNSGYYLNRSGVTTQPTMSGYVEKIERTTTGTTNQWHFDVYDGYSKTNNKGTFYYQNYDTSDTAGKLTAMQTIADHSKANHNSATPQNYWYLNNPSRNEFAKSTYTDVFLNAYTNNYNMMNIVKAADYPIGLVLIDRCATTLDYGPQLVNAIIELNKKPGVLRTAAGKFYPSTTTD